LTVRDTPIDRARKDSGWLRTGACGVVASALMSLVSG
jgi:hypothetical protein